MGIFALPKVDEAAPPKVQADQWVKNAIDNLQLYREHGGSYLLGFATYAIQQSQRIENENNPR